MSRRGPVRYPGTMTAGEVYAAARGHLEQLPPVRLSQRTPDELLRSAVAAIEREIGRTLLYLEDLEESTATMRKQLQALNHKAISADALLRSLAYVLKPSK